MGEAIGTIIGAIIGGLIAIVGIQLNQNSDMTKWRREKLLDTYSNAIYYLIKLSISSGKKSAHEDNEVRQHFSEAQRCLILLRAYHSKDEASRLEECSINLADNSDKTKLLSDAAEASIKVVKGLMKSDKRIGSLKSSESP